MSKSFVLLGSVLLICAGLHAQPDTLWTRTYGGVWGDQASEVQSTADGGYIIAGSTESFGAGWTDFYLVKTDSNGDTLWTRTYGGNQDDIASAVKQTADGGYIIAGSTFSYGVGTPNEPNFYLVRTDSAGDTLWTRIYGGSLGEYCEDVQVTADGGYVLAGVWGFFSANADAFLIRTNSQGDTLWTRRYSASDADEALAVRQTIDGGFILAGWSYATSFETPDAYVVKTNNTGDTLWTRIYGGGAWDEATSIQQTIDGGYVLAGLTRSFGPNGWNFYVVKTDTEGNQDWMQTYGGNGDDAAWDIRQTADGGFIITGFTTSYGVGTPANSNTYLVRTDSAGDSLWTTTYGGTGSEYATSVLPAGVGSFVVAGRTESYGFGGYDCYLIKTTPDTTLLPPQPFARVAPTDSSHLGPDLELDFAWTASVDPNGDAVAYIFHLESPTFPSEYFSPSDTVTSDTTVTVTFAMFTDNMDDDHDFYWTVCAIAGGDTVGAENGQGFFTKYIIESADQGPALPSEYSLSVYPNPFNPSTTISFDIPQRSFVSLNVYDLLGRELALLLNETISAGTHSINWDCASCATGLYLIELRSDSHRSITKAMLLR